MRATLVFILVVSVLVHAEARRVQNRNDHVGWQIESGYQQQEDTQGYSAGSGLRSIAHGSARRAHSVLGNQYAAAQQAAYVAQNSLAQEASQAAATAQAALAGKEVLYKSLEKQIDEAQEALTEEVNQLKLAENSAEAAKEAADATDEQISALTDALKNVKSSAEQARTAADEAEAELASQFSMVGRAQERLNVLEAKWSLVEVDYETTRQASERASASAKAARDNASLARAYANQKVEESAWKSEEEPRFEYVDSSSLYHHLHRL